MTRRLDELTAAEEAQAEEVAGVSYMAIDDDKAIGRVKLFGALVWVYRKRTEPTLKYTEVMNSGTTQEFLEFLLEDPEAKAAEGGDAASFRDDEAEAPGGAAEAEDPLLSGHGRPLV